MVTEQYQRVWLRDVQGFFIRPSRQARWVTRVSLGLALLFGGLILLGDTAAVVFSILTGLAVMVLLYGLFLARNCHFHVVTAVQKSEWVNVARHRQARKLLARLVPMIHESQRDEAAARTAATVQAAASGIVADEALPT
jgi:membrane-bound ClpP family serine protease